MATSQRSAKRTSPKLISGRQGGRARTSVTPIAKEKDFQEVVAAYSAVLPSLLNKLNQDGLSWKTSLAFSAQMEGRRLKRLSTSWKKSGIWGYGSRATLSARVFPTIEKEYSLSEVINRNVLTTSILTAANCLGVIRRERRAGRGGKLDPNFRKSLFQTLRFWFSVAEASGIPKQKAIAPRYVPKLEAIKAAIQTDQYYVARNLTWNECEKLMGFPEGWTVAEGDSLATQYPQS